MQDIKLDLSRHFNLPEVSTMSYKIESNVRGIRNNNYGNIEMGANWLGLDKNNDDPRFCRFIDPIFGLRAAIKITKNYHRRHGIRTISDWANRWAPPFENKTNKYAQYLEQKTGTRILYINDQQFMGTFIRAVCNMENGSREIEKVWQDWHFDHAYIIS